MELLADIALYSALALALKTIIVGPFWPWQTEREVAYARKVLALHRELSEREEELRDALAEMTGGLAAVAPNTSSHTQERIGHAQDVLKRVNEGAA